MPEFDAMAISSYSRTVKSLVFKQLMLVALALALAAMLLGAGPNPQAVDPTSAQQGGPPGRVAGRAIIGILIAVESDTLTVSTSQGDFTLKLEADTRFSASGTRAVDIIGDLAASEGGRVAILADQKLVNDDGTPADQVSAVRISIIPSKATRQHKRVVAAEKSGNRMKALDSDGNEFDLDLEDTPDVPVGDSLVLIVRPEGNRGLGQQVQAVARSSDVDLRIDSFFRDLADNPQRGEKIEALLERREAAQANRLERTANNSVSNFGALVRESARKLREQQADRRQARRGNASLNTEPIPVTGGDDDRRGSGDASLNTEPIPVTGGDDDRRGSGDASLNTEPIPVTGGDDDSDTPPKISFLLPVDGAQAREGSTINVQLSISGDGPVGGVEISWPFVGDLGYPTQEGGGLWNLSTTLPTLPALDAVRNVNPRPHVIVGTVTVGGRPASDGTMVTAWVDLGLSTKVTLEALASDAQGNTGKASIELEVARGPILVAETTVADGSYSVLVSPLVGYNFNGKTITFQVAGVDAVQTVAWEQGGGDIANFTFDSLN